jgi:hypothetical protein
LRTAPPRLINGPRRRPVRIRKARVSPVETDDSNPALQCCSPGLFPGAASGRALRSGGNVDVLSIAYVLTRRNGLDSKGRASLTRPVGLRLIKFDGQVFSAAKPRFRIA